MTLDFTHKAYHSLLVQLKEAGYQFLRFQDYPEEEKHQQAIVIRHDVDRFPNMALNLARLERDLGIKSTYFFRIKPISFKVSVMQEIRSMGHELGYHYEELTDCKGRYELAWDMFRKNLDRFRGLGGVQSIAMHGRPFSKWDNRDLWKHYDYNCLGISMEAYLDVDWNKYLYFTDTGRRWDNKSNRKDKIISKKIKSVEGIKSTFDLIEYFRSNKFNAVISVHPERWARGRMGWTICFVLDEIVNLLKKAVYFISS